MKRIADYCLAFTCLTLLCCSMFPVSVRADTTEPLVAVTPSPVSPPSTTPDALVTALAADPLPEAIEIFSQADTPLNLANWQAVVTVTDDTACASGRDITINSPTGWLLPKHPFTVVRDSAAPGNGTFTIDSSVLDGCTTPWLSSLKLTTQDDAERAITIPDAASLPVGAALLHRQRSYSLNTTRALRGTFSSDYSKQVSLTDPTFSFYSDPLYTPPVDTSGLQILEILPNARTCSPLETDITCGDYIKLYNPTDSDINLASYRLRVGYKGQSTSIANTFTWGTLLDPLADELILPARQYLTPLTRNDGAPLSLTDSGAYIWLEDAYGTTVYDPVVQYPDAGSVTSVGQAWAYDGMSWR